MYLLGVLLDGMLKLRFPCKRVKIPRIDGATRRDSWELSWRCLVNKEVDPIKAHRARHGGENQHPIPRKPPPRFLRGCRPFHDVMLPAHRLAVKPLCVLRVLRVLCG